MGVVDVRAIDGVSFTVKKGEFLGITGSSGSGKSTLLHMLGLLDPPTEGTISIDGRDVISLSEAEKGMFRLSRFGFIFQDYALVPELTAEENVSLVAMARGDNADSYAHRAKELLGQVGLGDRTMHLPSELSGGEQQRVAIARALINAPEILFADEPCANLDSTNSRAVLDLFREINHTMDLTVIMVSHESWHKEYFDRIIRLHDGKIQKDFRPEHSEMRDPQYHS
ncbi:ABC transporter ATP-binding protein [Methanogenium organophilum]|uniref:ABC transporter ATP-binding protein n=1 Tax=Methanogenium organophilum TaxID=2199 RepID=A0A9X9T9Z9_METOG|nr:ABC transporter ATP-binding protein [Methanogenium organophilum]WAI02592.1 ABC transporter ATP-binding protein [Methanogenium organophilum]